MKTVTKLIILTITILYLTIPSTSKILTTPSPRKLITWSDRESHKTDMGKEEFKREFVDKIMGTLKNEKKIHNFHRMERKSLKNLGYLFERATHKLNSVSSDILNGLDKLNGMAEEDIN